MRWVSLPNVTFPYGELRWRINVLIKNKHLASPELMNSVNTLISFEQPSMNEAMKVSSLFSIIAMVFDKKIRVTVAIERLQQRENDSLFGVRQNFHITQ